MTTPEILRASLELLEDPEHWTQGAPARNAAGRRTEPNAPDACQWCMTGAVRKSGSASDAALAVQILKDALPVGPGLLASRLPFAYNDRPWRQHSEVLAVIRRAIELAEAEEQHA